MSQGIASELTKTTETDICSGDCVWRGGDCISGAVKILKQKIKISLCTMHILQMMYNF